MWIYISCAAFFLGIARAEIPCTCSDDTQYMCVPSTPGECTCIPGAWRCDKDVDCELSDDEEGCDLPACAEAEFTCTNKKCIHTRWKCDGDNDCGDGSDEQQCPPMNCTSGQFQCANGRCIRDAWRCDGDDDCQDGSDEICAVRTCAADEFECGDGSCISMAWFCDADIDCADASDENHCDSEETECKEEEFTCENGQCVMLVYKCDLQLDCADGSDEDNCEATHAQVCEEGEFRCDDGQCIDARWLCDGDFECDDQSDETNCPLAVCMENEFRCGTGRCIDSRMRCDHIVDCSDNTDEQDCDYAVSCGSDEFVCGDGTCLALSQVCNGYDECVDASDELSCYPAQSCTEGNGGCSHICTEINNASICACPPGFKLSSDRRQCQDIDECLSAGKCSQVCSNIQGSYVCTCSTGYQLRPDQHTCQAIGEDPSLIFANHIDIRRFTPATARYTSVVKNLNIAIALDYHYANGHLFWSDIDQHKIQRSFLNGSQITDIVTSGLYSTSGLAVDWVHEKLFWTDTVTARIEVATLDGKMRKVIVWEEIEKPRAIAVHPGMGCIFWTDWGQKPKVERTSMDGLSRHVIANTSLFWPNGITLDYVSERVYWVDAKHRVIESVDFDGNDRQIVLSSGLPHPFGLTLFEDDLYWTDWETLSIAKAHKHRSSANQIGVTTVKQLQNLPMDIKIYHPVRQPMSVNKCGVDNGGCSHLCLPNLTGYSCACPTGFMLLPDQHSCAENIKSFLLVASKASLQRVSFDAQPEAEVEISVTGVRSALDVDWHSATDYIYWSDIASNTISRARWDGNGQEVILDAGLESPTGLAVDWIANNLYFVDAGLSRIEVCRLDGSMRSVLIWQDMDRPRDIVLDPEHGTLYWSERGENARIETASMDGTSRRVIHDTDLTWPYGLALDLVDRRIYWTDAGRNTIEYSDLGGGNRQVLLDSELPHPFGIAVHEDKIYWTDWDTKSVERASKQDGSGREKVVRKIDSLMDIHVFHRQRPEVENPCSKHNGGCSHLCVLSADQGHSCLCPSGIMLDSDGKTCKIGMDEFLLVACRSDLRTISLDTGYYSEVVLPMQEMKHAIAVAMDTVEKKVYWSDSMLDSIQRANLDGTEIETVINIGLDTPDGLAIDSAGRKMYWTDTGSNRIEVATLDGSIRKVLVWEDLDSPRAIALHVSAGLMFWTDWGAKPRIERADLDGSNRLTLVDTRIAWPNGIAVDIPTSRVIWADARTRRIESIDLNGNDRRLLVPQVPHPYGLTVTDSAIYWTDWKLKAVARADKITGRWAKIQGTSEGLAITAVNMNMNAKEESVCGDNNGECSHLCLPKPGGFTCACPTGLLLQPDAKTCYDMPTKFLLFASRGSLRTISMDTPDSSDVYVPLPNLHNAIALDYDFMDGRIYYTDLHLDVIRRAFLNGSGMETIVDTELSTTDGIAVDWIAKNLYWTDTGRKVIEVARIDGSSRKVVVKGNLGEPRAIVLYPKKGLMFWSDWGVKPRIERSHLDGSSRKPIVEENLGWPNGLCLDLTAKRIYWADAKLDRIETTDLNGNNRRLLVANLPHPFGLAIYGNNLYMTDWQDQTIERLDKETGGSRVVIQNRLAHLMDIKVVAPDKQIGTNPCAYKNGLCTHLCLARPNDYVCACPDYPDGRPCSTIPGGNHASKNDAFDRDHIECSGEIGADGRCKEKASHSSSMTHTIALIIGALLTLLIIGTCLLVLLICRRKRKRRDLDNENLTTFNNPTYHQSGTGEPSVCIRPRQPPKRRLFKYFKNEERLQEVGAEQKPNNKELAALLPKQPNVAHASDDSLCAACSSYMQVPGQSTCDPGEDSDHMTEQAAAIGQSSEQSVELSKQQNVKNEEKLLANQDSSTLCRNCGCELGGATAAAANLHVNLCKLDANDDQNINICKLDSDDDKIDKCTLNNSVMDVDGANLHIDLCKSEDNLESNDSVQQSLRESDTDLVPTPPARHDSNLLYNNGDQL